jgi:AcrR family transcriptional regulator
VDAFARHGFDRASLNAILGEAGLGKSSFFYHFADKEDLFAAVIEDIVERIAERVGPTPLPDSPEEIWAAAADLVRRWGEAVDAEPKTIALLRALQPLRRTAGPRLQNALSAARRSFEPLLERGIALGAVRSDLDPATLLAMIEAVDLVLDDTFHRRPNHDATAVETHRILVFDTIERLLRPSLTKRSRGTAIGRKRTPRVGSVRLSGPRL